jgi:hypothetical protein
MDPDGPKKYAYSADLNPQHWLKGVTVHGTGFYVQNEYNPKKPKLIKRKEVIPPRMGE